MITLSYQKLMRFCTNRRLNDALYELLCCLSINQRRIKALASRFDDHYQRRANLLNPTAVSASGIASSCVSFYAALFGSRCHILLVSSEPTPACSEDRPIRSAVLCHRVAKSVNQSTCDPATRDSVWLPYVIKGDSSLR